MTKDILRIINETGVYSKHYIAKQLNISEGIVEDILFRLINLGYIREDETGTGCTANCSTCPLANCSKDIIKTFTITDKGLNTLAS